MHLPLGTIKFREGVEFTFPNQLCCNCGTKKELQVISQDTRRTTYLLAGGTEIIFQLPLPFCSRCVPSAKRRPKNIVHWLLLFVLSFAAYFFAVVLLGNVIGPAVANYVSLLAVALAILTTLTIMFMAKPAVGQSSYFQPVRIQKLKREFLSGVVTGIGFSFTNRAYAHAFRQENAEAIARNQLFVDKT